MPTTTRRNALKFISLGLGSTAIAPTFLLQACKEAATSTDYTYATFSAPQATALRLIQDMILPKTDTSPAASEVGSVAFADAYVTYAYKPEDKARLLHQLDRFAAKLKETHEADIDDATPEHVEAMFKTYFVDYKAPEEKESGTVVIEGNTVKTGDSEDKTEIDGEAEASESKLTENLNTHEQVEGTIPEYGDDAMEINAMLKGLRGMTLESYFQSEEIGENVLNYDEVPGHWVGQMPLAELPHGRSWSL